MKKKNSAAAISARLLRKFEKRFDDVFPPRPKITESLPSPRRRVRRRRRRPTRSIQIISAATLPDLELAINQNIGNRQDGVDAHIHPVRNFPEVGFTVLIDTTVYPSYEDDDDGE